MSSVSIDNSGCRDIIAFVQRELEPLGLFIKTDPNAQHPWLLATTQPTTQPKLLLAAHLDTVPASHPSQLTAKVVNGNLHGRGAWDMKFAAACFIELCKQNQKRLKQHDFGLLFTTDEEIGGHSMLGLLKNGLNTEVVILPDSAKPWTIEQRAKGIIQAELTAHGINGHGSRPWESENAIHKLLPALEELRRAYPSLKPEAPTLSINIISGGKPQALTMVPDTAKAHLDIRAFHPEELTEVRNKLRALAKTHHLDIHYYVDDPALILNQHNRHVKTFVQLITKQRGTVLFADAYGGTDGRHFARYNIPCIIVSPEGNGFHQPDEWVKLADLVPFCQLLEAYIFETNSFAVLKPAKNAAALDETVTR